MKGIHSLGLALIPGSLQTYYSPGAEKRARYLQNLLGGELDYYAEIFHTRFSTITLAVLNAEQWPIVAADDPYGMPSVSGPAPYVFVMPASWNEVTWMPLPRREKVPPNILRKALADGNTWDQVKFEGCDGIGAHEIGHTIIDQLGIDPQTHWLNEFLASYVGYAYIKTINPRQGLSNDIFMTQGLDAPHPFTKLEDFETKYDELMQKYPANYGWYQLVLDQRVLEIYRQSGVDFLRKIQAAFPKDSPKLTSRQVLEKLEHISPGWHSWSRRVEAGDVKPINLSVAKH